MELIVQKYSNVKETSYTKALRFVIGGKVKLVLSYSVATNGRNWKDNGKDVTFGLLTSKEEKYTATALMLGKIKFTALVGK